MERLTRRSKVGEGLPVKHLNLMHMDNTSEDTLTEILDKLADYEETGLTSEVIYNLEDIARRQSNCIIRTGLQLVELEKDRDYWEREAKKWCDKLFDVRQLVEGGE